MANLYNADLIVATLKQTALTVLQDKLAPLSAFSTDFGMAEIARGKVYVEKVTGTGAVQVNPTNFEAADTVSDKIEVQASHYSKGFGVLAADIENGQRLANKAAINLQALADKLWDVVMANITATNFGAAAVAANAADFDVEDLRTLWAALEKANTKNIVLSGAYFARFMQENLNSIDVRKGGAYFFDGFYHSSRWSAAVDGTLGFACDPVALGVAAGLPVAELTPEGEMLAQEVVTTPLGISVQSNLWFNRQTRSTYASYDVMFGCGVGDTTALKRITAAA